MTVTQRSREIALLRAIGARRRQVMSSLLLEALVLGLAASAIGFGLGVAVAKGLKALMDAVGLGPAVHHAAGRAQHHLGLARWSAPSSPSSPPWSRPAGPPRCCRSRRCASPPRVPRSRRSAGPSSALAVLAAGVAGMLSALYGDASMKVFGLGLLAAMVGVMVALPLVGASAGRRDRRTAAAARHARRAGEAERDAQPAPYLCHGGGADDRPDPGREHGRLRLVAEGVVRRRPRRPDQRRPVRRHLERPGARASARRSSTRSQDVDGVDDGLGQRLGRGPLRRRGLAATPRSTRPTPRTS